MPTDRTVIYLALAGFLALFAAMGIARFAFTPLLPPMHAEGLLSIGQGGLVASVHFLGYAMGALLAGFITGAPRFALYGSLILIAVTTAATARIAKMSHPAQLVPPAIVRPRTANPTTAVPPPTPAKTHP